MPYVGAVLMLGEWVDFHYEVDGLTYDFSIPGGGYITLKQLVEVLGITAGETEAGSSLTSEEFVSEVSAITFSNPELLWAGKAEEDTTIGALRDANDISVAYSAELSEEEITSINNSIISLGDWVLISLKPFTTDETLTVTMKNGDVWTLRVTDASSYPLTYRVSNADAGVVYTSSTTYGSSRNTNTVSNDDAIKVSNNTWSARSATEPTNSNKTAAAGYRFVWWIADREASLDNETWIPAGNPINASGIKPYVKQGTTFTAWYTNENDKLVLYNTEDHGTIDKEFSNSSDSEGAIAAPNENYTFLGWYDQNDNLVCATKSFDLSKVTTDMIVTAKYQAPITINYEVKIIDAASTKATGTVSRSSEMVAANSSPQGSTATAKNGVFLGWQDENGVFVSYDREFVPSGGQIQDTTYYAVFSHDTSVFFTTNDTDLVKFISTFSGNNAGSNLLNNRSSNNQTVYAFKSNAGITANDRIKKNTDPVLVMWKLIYSDADPVDNINGTDTTNNGINPNNVKVNDKKPIMVIAIVKPANTFIVNYECTDGGAINNTTDYAGSSDAKGATAKPNTSEGYRFLGWYTTNANDNEIRLTTSESFDATELASWISSNGGTDGKAIFKDEQVITAKFGIGHTISYKKKYGETIEELGTEITASGDDRKGYTAPNDVPGYNFSAWYLINEDGTETELSKSPSLTNNDLKDLEINSDVTILAKYEKSGSATYKVNYIGEGKDGVSNFGKVVVNLQSVEYDGSFTDTAGSDGKLNYTAIARPARGCEFVNWTVTDKEGNPITLSGLNVNDPEIENLTISDDVILTANFQKKSGAIEVIYNIQYDTQAYYYATIKVGDKSASGTQYENAYLSEVVPTGETALGCSASPLSTARIIGWTYGEDNTADRIHGNDKDNVFLMSSQFVPAGDYLKDEDGTGYRYYSVITKPADNVYIQTKVNIAEAGDWWHGDRPEDGNKSNNSYYTDKILFVFNRTRTYEQQNVADAMTNFKTNFTPYSVDINPGYKLIGFTYNGVDVEVDYTTDGDNNAYVATDTLKTKKLSTEDIKLKESVEIKNAYYIPNSDEGSIHYHETITVDNLYDFIFYSTLFRQADGEAGVDKDVNVLIANYVKTGNYNFQYRIKSGEGAISKYSDYFSRDELTAGEKEDGSELIIGSLAMDNLDKDSVFVRWEYTDEDNNTHYYTDPQLDANAIQALTGKDLNELECDPKIYTFYAVFEPKKKVIVKYVSEDPNNKGTVTLAEEVVYESKTPSGSTAEPFPGMSFDNWTLERDGSVVGENTTLIPIISSDIFDYDPENEEIPVITYIAHFNSALKTKITVEKIVTAEDDIKDRIDSEVFFGVYRNGQLLKNKDGSDMIKGLNIIDGVPQGTVSFEGLEYNNLSDSSDKYEIWELHKVGNSYIRTYAGMLIGDDYVLSAIKGTHNSSYVSNTFSEEFVGGNNAILTSGHAEATVRIENVYTSVNDPLTFVAKKVWSNRNNNEAPVNAKVELTIYSCVKGVTTAVKSIILDGTVDENGETEPWVATFTNLPQLEDGGFYEVKETSSLPVGYTAYVGNQVMTPNGDVYLTTSGGKIYNVRNVDPVGTLIINKSFTIPSGYNMGDFAKALAHKVEFTLTDSGSFNKTITLAIDNNGKVTGAEMEGYTPSVDDGVVTIPGLPPGDYLLTEQKESTISILSANGQFIWTLEYDAASDVQSDNKCEITIGGETKAIVTNTYSIIPVTLKKVGVSNVDSTQTPAPLEGAQFKLHFATPDGSSTEYASGENGIFFTGSLPLGTYYLEETFTPAGYYALPGMIKLVVTAEGVTAAPTWNSGSSSDQSVAVTGDMTNGYIVTVQNVSGVSLPYAGGIGTTIFYVTGGVLVLLAGILLVTRSRMKE